MNKLVKYLIQYQSFKPNVARSRTLTQKTIAKTQGNRQFLKEKRDDHQPPVGQKIVSFILSRNNRRKAKLYE